MNLQFLENPSKKMSKTTNFRRKRYGDISSDESEDKRWREFPSSSELELPSTVNSDNFSEQSSQSETVHDRAQMCNMENEIHEEWINQNVLSSPNIYENYISTSSNEDSSSTESIDDSNDEWCTDDTNSQSREFCDWNSSDASSSSDEGVHFQKLKKVIRNDEYINIRISFQKSDLLHAALKYCDTYELSQSGTADLFKLINCILRQKILPESRYLFDQLFTSKEAIEYHAICSNCKTYIRQYTHTDRSLVCDVCDKVTLLKSPLYRDFFTIINIENDVIYLLQQNMEHLKEVFQDRTRDINTFGDFTDGLLYKQFLRSLPQDERINFVTATFNTDGAPVFESSKFSIWPIQIIINELPYEIRTARTLTCGLWFGKDKPDMDIFLNPFINMMNKLSIQGVTFKFNEEEFKIRVHPICCCVDTVARAPMQGLIQFNGYYGCNWCLHPGEYIETMRGGSVKYTLQNNLPRKRTENETLQYMKQSLTCRLPIYGVKRPSRLILLNNFNIIDGFVPDAMHCVSLGVAKQFLSYWIENKNMPYSLSKEEIDSINNVIINVKVPNQLTRLSRGVTERNWWKAREWENWILFYSIPVMLSFPRLLIYTQHWSLLVEAFYLLNQNIIDHIFVETAHELLKKFVFNTEVYYSKNAMTYNIHQLLHLSQSVLNFGPLWAHSGYTFESGNGRLLRKIHAAKGVIHQICRSINITQSECLLRQYMATKPYSLFHSYINHLENRKFQNSLQIVNTRYLGQYKSTDQSWIDNLQLSRESVTYTKIIKNKCLYTSYKRRRLRSNNSFAILDDDTYVVIRDFIIDRPTLKEYILCKIVNVENLVDSFNIKKIVNISSRIVSFSTSKLLKICANIKTDDCEYLCAVPNLYHY